MRCVSGIFNILWQMEMKAQARRTVSSSWEFPLSCSHPSLTPACRKRGQTMASHDSLQLMWVLLASEKIEENITLGSTEVPMDRVWASVIMTLGATDDT